MHSYSKKELEEHFVRAQQELQKTLEYDKNQVEQARSKPKDTKNLSKKQKLNTLAYNIKKNEQEKKQNESYFETNKIQQKVNNKKEGSISASQGLGSNLKQNLSYNNNLSNLKTSSFIDNRVQEDFYGYFDIDFSDVSLEPFLMAYCLHKTFLLLESHIKDNNIGRNVISDQIVQAISTLTVVIQVYEKIDAHHGKFQFITANVGNTNAVIFKKGLNSGYDTSFLLNTSHTPKNKDEIKRIENVIKENPQIPENVDGLTRILGHSQNPNGLVIADPEVSCCEFIDDEDFLLILASEGYWSVINTDETVEILKTNSFQMPENENKADILREQSYISGSVNNTTVLVAEKETKSRAMFIADGYNGPEVAKFCSDNFQKLFLTQLAFFKKIQKHLNSKSRLMGYNLSAVKYRELEGQKILKLISLLCEKTSLSPEVFFNGENLNEALIDAMESMALLEGFLSDLNLAENIAKYQNSNKALSAFIDELFKLLKETLSQRVAQSEASTKQNEIIKRNLTIKENNTIHSIQYLANQASSLLDEICINQCEPIDYVKQYKKIENYQKKCINSLVSQVGYVFSAFLEKLKNIFNQKIVVEENVHSSNEHNFRNPANHITQNLFSNIRKDLFLNQKKSKSTNGQQLSEGEKKLNRLIFSRY